MMLSLQVARRTSLGLGQLFHQALHPMLVLVRQPRPFQILAQLGYCFALGIAPEQEFGEDQVRHRVARCSREPVRLFLSCHGLARPALLLAQLPQFEK